MKLDIFPLVAAVLVVGLFFWAGGRPEGFLLTGAVGIFLGFLLALLRQRLLLRGGSRRSWYEVAVNVAAGLALIGAWQAAETNGMRIASIALFVIAAAGFGILRIKGHQD